MSTTHSLKAFDQLATARRSQRGTPVPQIPLAQIAPLAGQPRKQFDPETLAELADSIKAHGVIQPIILIARKEIAEDETLRYGIVCGERRFHAARLAGLDAIPALVRDYAEDEVALLALLENLQREDLTPLEEGEYLYQLKQQYGFTEEQLGERLGKSRDYVHMRTRLLNLSPDLLAAWRDAESPTVFATLTPSHAILINQLSDEKARTGLLRSVLDQGLTVAETRERLSGLKEPKKQPEPSAVKAPKKAAPAAAPALPSTGPKLALDDLAVFELLAPLVRTGGSQVGLAELEEALKRDLAWVRQIAKDGLRNG